MRDKMARRAIEGLAGRMGCNATFEDFGPAVMAAGVADEFSNIKRDATVAINFIRARIAALEAKFAAQEESAKPVCKSCGQKIQEGLQVGNVEALAAGLKKGGNSKK